MQAARIETPIWTGGLLPAFIMSGLDQTPVYIKTTVNLSKSSIGPSGGKLALTLGSVAVGELTFQHQDYGLDFTNFSIEWTAEPLPIAGLLFWNRALVGRRAACRADA